MQDENSLQTSLSTSDQNDWKMDDITDSKDDGPAGEPSFAELDLLSVMSQRDMETLTSWFPKSARALASILRTR